MAGANLWVISKIFLFVSLVYTLVLLPPAALLKYGILPLFLKNGYSFFLGLLLAHINLWVLLLSAVAIPGICWRVLNLRYSGSHNLDISDKDVRHWLMTHMIYTPTAVTLDFFHLYPLKAIHIRLFGTKVGKNVVAGGLVLDPSLLEIGDNSNIGGFSTILGHSVERGKIYFRKVTIGKNCGIGVRATVLPGVSLQDNAMLGAQSLLTKNIQVPGNETFGGVPAKKIASKIK